MYFVLVFPGRIFMRPKTRDKRKVQAREIRNFSETRVVNRAKKKAVLLGGAGQSCAKLYGQVPQLKD